ncbi:unnamed protein product [Parnassius mnemosyne]|uniref:VWFC domain-containing protein n=1 Tax=Parnassius mnemosyne TaxID=213953 RepID=A0AAV1K922_9NEOP
MKAFVIGFVMFLIGTALTDIASECNLAGFYMELGCTPIPNADNSTKCPDAFTCPDLHPDPSMCYYRGVPYRDRTMIPQNMIKNPCSLACQCSVSGKPRFDCAAVDCVETFDTDLQQQCINTYELGSCCSSGTVCGKDAIASLKTCEVDGQTYREGESFEPKNSRKTCVCTAQWNGTLDDPKNCRDINCGIEIHYQDKLFQNCAPIFLGSDAFCPIAFTCPTNTSKVIRGLNLRAVSAECVFGNVTLSVGDEVTVDEKCTKCKCNVPPFVSCTKKNSCNE